MRYPVALLLMSVLVTVVSILVRQPERRKPVSRLGPVGAMALLAKPGELLPGFARMRLAVTPAQQRQLDELQRDIDAGLARILSDEQRRALTVPRPK